MQKFTQKWEWLIREGFLEEVKLELVSAFSELLFSS